LLDRFDIQIEVPRLPATLLAADRPPGVASVTVRNQVTAARQRQLGRQGTANVELSHQGLEEALVLDAPSRALLTQVIERHRLSARGYVRILRVARTIADLAGQPTVDQNHIAEAVGLRCSFSLNSPTKL